MTPEATYASSLNQNFHTRVKTNYKLYAANGTTIDILGFLELKLNVGLRGDYVWRFIVANVTKANIGVEFLSHYS